LAEEMARHLDDVVFRRLPIGHDPSEVIGALPVILDRMTAFFAWDATRRGVEKERVLARLAADVARLDDALGRG
jgi:hypothetical protein